MFSENECISKRQIRRLFLYDLFGITTLLLPTKLADVAGIDGIFCIMAAGVLIFGYFIFLRKIILDMKGDYKQYLEHSVGKIVAWVILFFYGTYCVLFGSYALYTISNLIINTLLQEESYWLVASLVALLGAYGIMDGMEGRARVYELLFWFIFVPLLIMLFFSCKNVNVDYWTPVFQGNMKPWGKGVYLCLVFWGSVFLLPFFVPFIVKREKVVTAAKETLIITVILNVVVYLILLGVFQSTALREQQFPIVVLMSMIDLPGGFLKRQDAFMVGIWFFTLFALLNTGLFYSGSIFGQLLSTGKKHGKWNAFIMAGITLALAGVFYKSEAFVRWYYNCLWYVATPGLILIPIIAFCCQRREKE